MAKQTISLSNEDMRVINVVKAVQDIKNIPNAVSFIIQEYAETESYSKFIQEKRGEVKSQVKKN